MKGFLTSVSGRYTRLATSLGYPLRVALAATLALSLSTGLHLEEPHWAAWTVISVGLPVRGDSLRKCANRLLGTLVGVSAAVIFLSTLRDTPYLLLLALAIWLGITVYVGSLLQGFRSYAGLLAGYTAVILTVGGLAAGREWRLICISRTCSILIGIVGGAVASISSTRGDARVEFRQRFQKTISLVCRWVAQRIDSGRSAAKDSVVDTPRVRSIFNDIARMDREVSNLIVEAPGMWRLRATLREISGELLEVVFAARVLDRQLRHSTLLGDKQASLAGQPQLCLAGREVHDAVLTFVHELITLLGHLADALADPTKGKLDLRLKDLDRFVMIASKSNARSPAERRILDAGIAIASLLSRVLSIDLSLTGATTPARPASPPLSKLVKHQDRLRAGINGARAFVVLAGCGTAWLVMHRQIGSVVTIFAAILIALYSMKDRPHTTTFSFLTAGVQGVAAALTVRWLFLTLQWGRVELILLEGLVVLIAVTVGTQRSDRLWTTGFSIVFLSLADPAALLALNFRQSAGEALGVLAGVAIAAAAYSLLPPVWLQFDLQRSFMKPLLRNPERALRSLVRRMNSGISRATWSAQRFDWIMRILLPVLTEEQLAEIIRLTDAEIEILRIRDALQEAEPSQASVLIRYRLDLLEKVPLSQGVRGLTMTQEALRLACQACDQKLLRVEASLSMLILDLNMLCSGDAASKP